MYIRNDTKMVELVLGNADHSHPYISPYEYMLLLHSYCTGNQLEREAAMNCGACCPTLSRWGYSSIQQYQVPGSYFDVFGVVWC